MKKRLNRRTILKGMGAIGIGLPLLEEMMLSTAAASPNVAPVPADVPIRAFNVFFGLGIPSPLQKEGFDGVLEPLKALGDKLLVMRNVDQVRCDESGINAHFDGASGAFTAEPPRGEAKSGGPSIDQVIRNTHYPNGLPDGIVPTLAAGTYFRRSRMCRYVHSFKQDGTVAARMQERPRDLFDRVFGSLEVGDPDSRKQRLRRSVLDSVVDQYKLYTGKNSPLGSASRVRVREHLERIREFERRAYQMKHDNKGPKSPILPPRSELAHGTQADPDGQGIDMPLGDLTAEWRLMADLFALAVELDRVRIGSLTFLAAGERLRVTGDYVYDQKKVFEFNDAKQLRASGDKGCSHEWWHKFNEKKKNEALRAHAHMKMREVAYFLKRLDETKESNGKSILENSLVTISTESGDGRHNDVKRELSGVFHAITGANGRFKTGEILDVGEEGIDVYNTMLAAMGATTKLGPKKREGRIVESILS
jgi:hypothetical protein